MMLIQLILTSFIVPKSQDMARSFLRNSTVNFYGNFIKPQRFNDTISGVTIYSEKKNTDGDLYNIYIKREINKDEFQLTYAKKGIFSEINNNPFLILFDGETISGKNNNITNFSFSRSDFSLKNMDANTTTYKKTQELSSINLLKCLKKIKDSNVSDGFEYKEIENCHSKNFRSLLKEFYKRIIIPIYIPILMLIPFLLIISSKESSQYSKLKFFTFFIGLLVIIFSEITIRFISENIGDNLFISSVPILVLFLLYFIFLKKFNLKIK
jgi:lipopolysaccharide export system permease protein